MPTIEPLTAEQREVLEFERAHEGVWPSRASKENHVLTWFGFTITRYHQILDHVINQPAADAYDPTFVRRLRHLRARRRTPRGATR